MNISIQSPEKSVNDDKINESLLSDRSGEKSNIIEESVEKISEVVEENISIPKNAESLIQEEILNESSSDQVVEKRSTEDISSLVSDVVIPQYLDQRDKSSNKLNLGSSLSISNNFKLNDKIILEKNKKEGKITSGSTSTGEDNRDQFNLSKNLGLKIQGIKDLAQESEIASVIETYESDFDKIKSSSSTNKENIGTLDDSSIQELSFNDFNGEQLKYSTVGMVR